MKDLSLKQQEIEKSRRLKISAYYLGVKPEEVEGFKRKIVDYYQDGHSLAECEKTFEVTFQTIWKWIKKAGATRSRWDTQRAGYQRKLDAIAAEIVQEYLRQPCSNDLIRKFRMSRPRLIALLKSKGIEVLSPGEAKRWKFAHNLLTPLSGSRHPNWRGGRRKTPQGYIFVRKREHPKANKQGYIQEHVLVWEEEHGPIPEGFIIHHLNGIKDDNRLENFCCMSKRDRKGLIAAFGARIQELERELRKKEDS